MAEEPQVLKPSFVGRVVLQGLGSVEDRLVSLAEPRIRQIEAKCMAQAVVPDTVK
jgi:hypothetical protein